MLSSLHTSDIRRYIPRLIHLGEVQPGKTELGLYRLDWDAVDEYKNSDCGKQAVGNAPHGSPGTLPNKPILVETGYDERVKALQFAIPAEYKRAIKHFTTLFVTERCGEWGFDTCVRDHCLEASAAAINTSFYLLSDCLWEGDSWMRDDRYLLLVLMKYKFWRLYTGRGLVQQKAGVKEFDDMNLNSRLLPTIRDWELEQEKYWSNSAVRD